MTTTFSGNKSPLAEASAEPISLAQDFFSYENLKDDFNCNINGVLQGEWYSREQTILSLRDVTTIIKEDHMEKKGYLKGILPMTRTLRHLAAKIF